MWYNKYVGIPYKDNGRDETGLDCWGLVRLVYKNEYDIELPSFVNDYIGSRDIETTSELISRHREGWQQCTNRTIGSVVLLKIFGAQTHVGVYIGNNKFLHARENHAAAIESLDSTMWKNRVVGFFKYVENTGIIVNGMPNPLKTQRYVEVLPEGITLKQVVEQINDKYKISKRLKSKIVLLLNGKLAEERDLNKQLTRFDTIEYRLVPEGGNALRSVLMIAVLVIANMAGQYYANSVAAAEAAAAAEVVTAGKAAWGIGAYAVQFGTTVVGMALVDAIAPIRMPNVNENNPGSPVGLNLFTGGSNRANLYGSLPVVLGKTRITPPLAASTLLQPEEYTSYMSMNLCWGVGDLVLDESTLMVGGVELKDYITDDHTPEIITLDNNGISSTANEIAQFKTIFSTDVKQVYPNQELTADAQVGVPGPWKEVILENQGLINKFTVTLNFPEGLRVVYTSGNDAGISDYATAQFAIEYAKKIPGTSNYEAFTSSGTTAQLSQLYVAQKIDCVFPRPVYSAEGTIIAATVGFWTRVGIRRNSLVILRGAVADTNLGTPQTASQSQALQDHISANSYAGAFDQSASGVVYPQFTGTGTEAVTPLFSLWTTSEGTTQQIDHTTAQGITKTGMAVTLTDIMSTTYADEYSAGTPVVSGKAINIGTGVITNGNNVSLISLNQLRKDAFNYTTAEISVPLGDYKVRVRRLDEVIVDYDGGDTPAASLNNPLVKIPSTGNLNNTGTDIIVGLGDRDYMEYTNLVNLPKWYWKISSIVVPTGITLGSYTPWAEDARVLKVANIASVSPSFTAGDITYNIEAMNGAGSVTQFQLVQRVEKSANANAYRVYTADYVLKPRVGTGSIIFEVSDPTNQATDTWTRLPGNQFYYTIFEQSLTEPATATLLQAGELQFAFNSVEGAGLTLFDGNTVSNPTFANLGLYTYKVRLYADQNKTQLLDECRLVYRHSGRSIAAYRTFNKAILYAITGYTNQDGFVAPKYKLNNVLTDCRIVRTAIKLQSSSKVNGQVDGINGIVQSIGYNWYPTNPNTSLLVGEWKREPINNPASLFLYVLTHPANAYRVASPSTTLEALAEQVDMNTVKEWHYYCQQQNFTFNTVLENATSVMDVLKDVCAAGRASPLLKDGKWSVVIDKPKTDIVQHFTPHNSWGFEGVRIIPRVPDAFKTVIRDENNGYTDKEIIVYNQNKNVTNSDIFEQITLPGITNEDTAVKHIRWNLAQLNHRPERYTINTDLEYLVCNRGDRVKVVHDIPLWGTASGRMSTVTINGSQRQIDLDDDVLLQASTNYIIRVRLSNGRFELGSLQVAQTQYYSALTYTVTQSAPSGSPLPSSGDLFLIGTTDTAINDLLVLSIETLDNKNARIVLTDYSPTIFTENQAQIYSNISSRINYNPPDDLTSSIVVAPVSVTFNSGEITASAVAPGILSYNITATIQHAATLPPNISGVEVQYIPVESTFDSALNVTSKTFTLSESVILPDVVLGQQYKIRLRYTGSNSRVGPWMMNGQLNYFTHTVQVNQVFDDRADSIDVDLDRSTMLITINRSTATPASFSHYELRILKDPDSLTNVDFWDAGDDPQNALYGDIIKATTINGQFNISLLSFAKPRLDPNGVMYRIACRTVDMNGNKSRASLIKSYLLTPLE